MAAYLSTMLAVVLIALMFRREGMTRAAVAILGNWVAVYSFNALFGTYCPWVWFIVVDTICARYVLQHPASRWQIIIAALYMVQIAGHVAYGAIQATHGFPDPPLVRLPYWYGLLYASYVQLALLFSWSAIDGGRLLHSARRGTPSFLSFSRRHPTMEGKP